MASIATNTTLFQSALHPKVKGIDKAKCAGIDCTEFQSALHPKVKGIILPP